MKKSVVIAVTLIVFLLTGCPEIFKPPEDTQTAPTAPVSLSVELVAGALVLLTWTGYKRI